MIIAIDGYEANVAHRVGIGRYAYELLVHMYQQVKSEKLKVKSEKQDVQFRIYLPTKPLADMPKETAWWEYHVLAPAKLWTFIALPFALLKDSPRADAVFSPTHYIPRFPFGSSLPRVMSIMDLSYLRFPELFRKKDLHQLVHWTRYSALHATRIFTISVASKNDIMREYGVPSDHVIVTYPGLAMPENKKRDLPAGFPSSYILSVGTLQPRKNYVRLIEAFSHFAKQTKKPFADVQLVIVGKKGWLYEEILAAPDKFGVADRVRFLDFVEDSELPALYSHALCYALPSLYEGFGLPVLEAMSYSCPVVVSRVSSLPEIAGKAGVYVDPENVDSITNGLVTAITERDNAKGKVRIKEGLAQVKKFTWGKAAEQTLAVLESLGKGNV